MVLHGLHHFCARYAKLLDGDQWEVPYRAPTNALAIAARFKDLMRADLAYSYTGRIDKGKFLRAAHALGKSRIIMVWCGSDTIFAQAAYAKGLIDPWVTHLVHWAIAPWLAEEVRALGVDCEYVPATQFVEIVKDPKPLPKKFSVLVYVRDTRKSGLYGWDRMVEVAQKLPHVEFNLYGLLEGQTLSGPCNIRVHSWTNNSAGILENSTVVYRPVRHDGLSLSVLEALSHGRHVVWTYPLRGCLHAPDPQTACEQLERLYTEHEAGRLRLNEEGRDYVVSNHNAEAARADLLQRFEKIVTS